MLQPDYERGIRQDAKPGDQFLELTRRDLAGTAPAADILREAHGTSLACFTALVKTDTEVDPPHRGMSRILAENGYPGFRSSRHIEKLGYRGVETTELILEEKRQPARNLL